MAFFSNDIWRIIFKIKTYQHLNKVKPILKDTNVIYSRKSFVPLCFRGGVFSIHKGYVFRKLELNKYFMNSKFGEYAYTRKLYYYPLKKKNRR
jgi:ribosomal protein S19